MAFVLRCLATEDLKNPIGKRCKNMPDASNGLLCKMHTKMAKEKPIHILMHHQVSKIFKIPFKNQVFVKIDLRDNKVEIKKPESKTSLDDNKRDIKNSLLEILQQYNENKLKDFHNKLNLNIWDKMKSENKNEYSFRYFISKNIIDYFEKASKIV